MPNRSSLSFLCMLWVGACTEPTPEACEPIPSDVYVGGSFSEEPQRTWRPVRFRVGEWANPWELSELSLTQGGQVVPGEWSAAQVSAGPREFHPTDELLPGTLYTLSAMTDRGCVEVDFTTSTLGVALEDPEALKGVTFELLGASSDVTSATILGYDNTVPFLLRVDELEGEVVSATLAPTITTWLDDPETPRSQDTCDPTTSIVGSWDGARAQFEGALLRMPFGVLGRGPGPVWGVEPATIIELMDWRLDLYFDGNGTANLETLSFTTDTRDLGDFFLSTAEGEDEGDGTPGNFCRIVSFFGASCQPCDDGLETCVEVLFRGSDTSAPVATDIVNIAEGQPENHLCAGACDNGVDDDGDGNTDLDLECNPSIWP